MERVAFLLEDSGQRLGCLLNPESLVLRRQAGIRPRASVGGLVRGAELADDPLLFTGGGQTELTLDLLFDVELAGSSIRAEDVRDLTRPLWDLTENRPRGGGPPRPARVRFVWGKSWNIPGVVTAIAERLEYFTEGGVPRRSWLRLRLRRVEAAEPAHAPRPRPAATFPGSGPGSPPGAPGEPTPLYEIVGGTPDGVGGERLDQLAYRFYGDASLWRILAEHNGMDDPHRLPSGQWLEIPGLSRPLGAVA